MAGSISIPQFNNEEAIRDANSIKRTARARVVNLHTYLSGLVVNKKPTDLVTFNVGVTQFKDVKVSDVNSIVKKLEDLRLAIASHTMSGSNNSPDTLVIYKRTLDNIINETISGSTGAQTKVILQIETEVQKAVNQGYDGSPSYTVLTATEASYNEATGTFDTSNTSRNGTYSINYNEYEKPISSENPATTALPGVVPVTPPANGGFTNVRDYLNEHFRLAQGNYGVTLTDEQFIEALKAATGVKNPTETMSMDYFLGNLNATGFDRKTDLMSALSGMTPSAAGGPIPDPGWATVDDFIQDHFRLAKGDGRVSLQSSQLAEIKNQFDIGQLSAGVTSKDESTEFKQLLGNFMSALREIPASGVATTTSGWMNGDITAYYENLTGKSLQGTARDDLIKSVNSYKETGDKYTLYELEGALRNFAEQSDTAITGTMFISAQSATDHANNMLSAITGGADTKITDEKIKELLAKYPDFKNQGNHINLFNDLVVFAGSAAKVTVDGGDNPGTTLVPAASGGASTDTRGNRPYRLVSGSGPTLANDTLRGNGNAVFIVSDSGELFHVTETLANELRANGWWYTPEELPQGEVDKMTLRTSLTYTAELGVLDMKPAGDYLLVRGNGAALSNAQLRGNSDAVFAVDKNGNMFHVTETVAKEMQANNTWMTPAMLNQQTVDGMKISGALTNAAGGTTPTLSIQPGTPVPAVMPAAGGPAPAPGSPVSPTSATFKLVRGKGPNLGTTQLLGNGAAVYALFEDGTKLHVTEAMAKELDAAGKWYEPQQLEQSEIDKTPPAGRLININGASGPLTVDYVAGGASTPSTSTPVPAVTPDGPKASDRAKELVQATFRQYFGKDGTAAEVEAYALDMDNGRSLNVIRAEISAKPEAASFREDLIQQTFQQFVGRAADADDLRIHNEKLMSGEVTPEQFRIGIANAQEAVDWQNAQVAGVSGQAQSMYGEAIQNIYRQQLGRDASPEELRMHTAALSDGSLNLQQLTDQVYWSPEGSSYRGEPVTSVGPGSSVVEPAPAAGPTWTPDVQYDRTGASRDLNDPKYGYNDARKQELRVHMWNQGTWEEIATIEDIYASGDAGRIDAWERFSQTGKYAPGASQPQQPTVASAAPAPAPAATAPSPSAVHGDAVRAAYRQYLGREAAQSEVDNWSSQAAGGTNIVSAISGSAEAAGYRQQIVRDTFRLYVCREPSAEDMAIHTDRLARGEVTPEQFRLGIVNASEAVINQNWLWAQQSPAAQAMYSEAINGIFVRQAGRPATQEDIRIHTAGLVNGLTNLQKLEENIASAVQNQGRLVKSGQVLGASTTAPMSSGLNTEGGTTGEDKPEMLTESAGSSDEDAIWVTDSAGVRRDISGLSWEKRAEVQKHVVEGGGSFNQLDEIENIYASGDASAIDNWERFSQTGKYSPSTPWGQTYQSVIKDGYSHELASAWADGSHADNMQAATTPVPGVAPAAATPNPNSFGVL